MRRQGTVSYEGCRPHQFSLHEIKCLYRLDRLPYIDFHLFPGNPVERIFRKEQRWKLLRANSISRNIPACSWFFTGSNTDQKKEISIYFGSMMGRSPASI
ncbi:MAG: hypothetical protein C5B59_17880 [Bacteroidetes bacterium]|nr:MAG: hypothetical protein C5B59_17880 [Bacteroidota bacterium]